MSGADSDDDILVRLRTALAGRYVVERMIGEGGMGRVYLGRDDALQRPVAIKVIRSDQVGREAARERFLQEARLVAGLRHPAIVTVFAAGEDDGLLWFAMEYVDGDSLRELMTREGRFAADRVQEMLAELAGALDAAHRQGVVHRDVKPENILVERESGRVRLADFGVARALEADARHTGTGIIVGSPRYMSPEQVSGDVSIDGRADLYSLALVGHEMLTGRPVLQATHPSAMLVEQLTTPAPALRSVLPDVPLPLARAIDGALVKQVDGRWADARAMLGAMGVTLTGNSFSGTGPVLRSPSTAGRDRVRRRVLSILAVLAATGLSGWGWWQGNRDTDARGLIVLPFDVPAGQPEQEWLREGSVNMLTLDLAQWRDLGVIDYERTLDQLREAGASDGRISLTQAAVVAKRVGAASFIMGKIMPSGDSLLVVARRYADEGTLQRTAQVTMAREADPRSAFDQLAVRLLDVPSATSLIALTSATTTSLQAYRDYLEGLRALNGWQLDRADSLFTRAVAADSTFALAWYKRGVTRGWNGFGDSTPSSAEIALRHSGRLPVRERRVVAGHRWLWAALDGTLSDSIRQRAFVSAIEEYRAGVSYEGASAEAWYGLADALWHFAQFHPDSSNFGARLVEARSGFEHALVLDPELHLAYSHLVDLHRQVATVSSRWIARGDAIVRDSGWADSSGRAAARAGSYQRMLEVAQRWAAADPNSPRSWQAVADALSQVGRPDSAAALTRIIDARLGSASQGLGLRGAFHDFSAGSPNLARNMRATLGDGGLPWWAETRRSAHGLMAFATGVAAASGDGALVDLFLDRWAQRDARDAADATVMSIGDRLRPALSERHAWRALLTPWWRTVLHATMGAPVTPATRAQLARGTDAAIRQYRSVAFDQAWLLSTAYAAFMLTGDTAHVSLVRLVDPAGGYPELDAAVALVRGDTAAARLVRRQFAPASRVRSSPLGLAGLRTQQRVLVLLALGDSTEAFAQQEAIVPNRFNVNAMEPGLAWYVRGLALRATLAERLGYRDRARATWQEVLQRWSVDDPRTAPIRAQARLALTRLGA